MARDDGLSLPSCMSGEAGPPCVALAPLLSGRRHRRRHHPTVCRLGATIVGKATQAAAPPDRVSPWRHYCREGDTPSPPAGDDAVEVAGGELLADRLQGGLGPLAEAHHD